MSLKSEEKKENSHVLFNYFEYQDDSNGWRNGYYQFFRFKSNIVPVFLSFNYPQEPFLNQMDDI